MENRPVIKSDHEREIYQALLKSARMLLKEDRFLRVVDSVISNETNAFDLSGMARTLNDQLEDKTAMIANHPGLKKETSTEGKSTYGDPKALKNFDGIDDETFFKGITNPTSNFR